jgi:hypothetical protein
VCRQGVGYLYVEEPWRGAVTLSQAPETARKES